ncbi:MAG: LytR/AlgR family response regulator transcription factor [Saprospiraceae bacterium]
MKNLSARILYLEDEGIVARNTIESLKNKGFTQIQRFKSWEEAEVSLKVTTYDAAILDVKLVGSALDGIDIGNILTAQFNLPIVITTSFSDDVTLTRLAALPNAQYLLKPFTAEQLDACLRRLLNTVFGAKQVSLPEESYLQTRIRETKFVQTDGRKLSRIDFDNILYLAADRSYTDIHLINGRQKSIELGIKAMIAFFDRDDLLQIHKSHAVPHHAILNITREQVELLNHKKLPVGRVYREELKLRLMKR